MLSLLKQRVYQIACFLRGPKRFGFVALRSFAEGGVRSPAREWRGSGKSAYHLPDGENAVSARGCYRIAEALGELYIASRGKDGAPKKILLDFDATDDPTHGDQEQSYYHGYFREHIYHPLLVFDGDTGQLITAVLRAGNTHASRSTVALLRRIVGLLRSTWPDVEVQLRADAGFAVPAVYEYCEAEGIAYTIALITNSRLEEMAASLLEEAKRRYEKQPERKVKLLSQGHYRAGSWDRERRVVLMDTLRRKLVVAGIERMQLDTLRLRLVKIGGRVRELLTKVRLHLAWGHPGQHLWEALTTADVAAS